MSFWGIEVKPGKPYTHGRHNRRLHVSQATLGNGTGREKCLVQCNIRTKTPVFLCSLFPSTSESCQLNLEFDESEDVVFSVIGPRSVHLTGYFVATGRSTPLWEDSESFGEDIANTESERFTDSEEDNYGGSFIDDGDLEVTPISSERADKKKTKICNQGRRRLKKKYQLSESEDQDDDEIVDKKKLKIRNQGRRQLKKYQLSESEDQGSQEKNLKVKSCASASDSEADDWFTASSLVMRESAKFKGLESNAKPFSLEDKPEGDAGAALISENKSSIMKSNLQSDHLVADIFADAKDCCELKKGKEGLEDANCNGFDENIMDDKYPAETKLDIEVCSKRKHRKRPYLEDGSGNTSDGLKDEKALNDKDCPKVSSDINGKICIDKQPKAKKVKKEKKEKNEAPVYKETVAEKDMEVDIAKPSLTDVSLLSNGLSFEEKELGVPNGKIAAPSKKIKIKYVAMLKDSGQVFDSNIGCASLKFRLGSDDIIDGLNVGLDGMRVGGKRRLVIPPSMGYGSKGFGDKVPPDSWLVYDVELVSVR